MKGSDSTKAIKVFPLVNDILWLKQLWVLIIFLSLFGAGLFAIPWGGFHITPFRLLMPMYLYLLLLTFFLYQGRISLSTKVGKYLLFLALWLLWAVVSLFWAPPFPGVATHIVDILSGLLLIIFSLLFLNTDKGIKTIYGLWIIFVVIFMGIGIWEVATGMHLSASGETQWLGIRKTYPSAVFTNPNDFATFLCLSFPFLFILLSYLKRVLPKVLVGLLILLSFYFVILVLSRGNIIAILIGVSLIVLLPRVRARFKSIALVLALLGLIVVLGLVFSLPVISSFAHLMGTVPTQMDSITPDEISIATRINLVKTSWVFLQGHLFWGVGSGSFAYWVGSEPMFETWGVYSAHNWWLEILVDYGVLIFALFLAFYIGLLWNLFKTLRNSKNQTLKASSLATFISLVEFSVASASSSSLFGYLFIWFLFGTALCIISCHRLTETGGFPVMSSGGSHRSKANEAIS